MKRTSLITLAILLFSFNLFAQNYSGPEKGTVPPGKVVSTDDFSAPLIAPAQFRIFNREEDIKPIPDEYNNERPASPFGTNMIRDNQYNIQGSKTDSVILFKDFQGFLHENSIPPDPYIAAGPEHLMIVVNGYFRILDKDGNELKTISASKWCSKVLPGASVFDPKVIYDHYSGRWVMVWLDVNDASSEAYYMLSVSDDSNPLGNWFEWAVPSNYNGSTPSGSWADYEGVGFDDKAIYLTSNQFTFGQNASYQTTRIRIINKKGIYVSDSASAFSYTDLWDIKYPGTTYGAFGLRPVRMYSHDESFYFVKNSPYVTGTQIAVYELIDPIGETPTLVSYKIPVTAYKSPPNANQLGGGTPLIEGGGAGIRNEPIFKNGIIYVVHSVEYKDNGTYSGVHFLALDIFSQAAKTDFVFGAPHRYYIYPALALDANNNVFISYSRSGDYEYCGAYFSVVPAGEKSPTGSIAIQPGKAHYIVTYGGSRNRWGDYNGAWQDPVDTNNVWLFSEFVNQTDRWGTWIAGARYKPFNGQFIFAKTKSIDFGELEIGKGAMEKEVVIKNYGMQQVTVSSAKVHDSQLSVSTVPSLPASLNAYDSVVVGVSFNPQTPGYISDSLIVKSDDANNPDIYIQMNGRAYEIAPVELNKLYGCTTSTIRESKLLTFDATSGQGAEIGSIEYKNVSSLTVNPNGNELVGLIRSTDYSKMLRINSKAGDGHDTTVLPVACSAISFAKNNVLYGVTTNKQLYRFDAQTLDTTLVMNLSVIPLTLAYNPLSGELWFSTRTGLNTGKLYKINLNSKSVTEVASLDILINDLCFDDSGDLFAVYGTSSYLTVIDTATGVNYDIGKTNQIRVKGLAIKGDIIVNAVENNTKELTPLKFTLEQNQPNPFNPTTLISFTLPENSQVQLNIYNLLGQKVTTLINRTMSAGNHQVKFNASNLSSGTYFYELSAKNEKGKLYKSVKKMILLK